MIKVIKHGNKYKQKITCKYCECEFEFDNKDIYYTNTSLIQDSVNPNCFHCQSKGYVKCPECNESLIISNEKDDFDEQ